MCILYFGAGIIYFISVKIGKKKAIRRTNLGDGCQKCFYYISVFIGATFERLLMLDYAPYFKFIIYVLHFHLKVDTIQDVILSIIKKNVQLFYLFFLRK